MPSSNSWGYYRRFIASVEYGHDFRDSQMDAVKELVSDIVSKSPSKQMAGSGLTDDFMCHASRTLCSGKWCEKSSCPHNNRWCIFNCSEKTRPAKCGIWRNWRKQRRSYPKIEACINCDYYKFAGCQDKGHACRCRKKVLPAHCPKAKPMKGKS